MGCKWEATKRLEMLKLEKCKKIFQGDVRELEKTDK